MLLCYDGLDKTSWMNEQEWANLDPNGGAHEGTEEEAEGEDNENIMQDEVNAVLEPFIANNDVIINAVIPQAPPIYTTTEKKNV
jgi:hypothetical protein